MLVRSMQAAQIGMAYQVPLGVAKADIKAGRVLHSGSQGSVTEGVWKDFSVAVKKAKISTNADLARFRAEVQLLLLLGKHRNIVHLIGARLLPPGHLSIWYWTA